MVKGNLYTIKVTSRITWKTKVERVNRKKKY